MKKIFSILIILLNSMLLFSMSLDLNEKIIEHKPIEGFNYGDKVDIRIKAKAGEAKIYFKYDGIEQFQIRNMEKKNGHFDYLLDTSLYISKGFKYYFEIKINEEIIYIPEGAPEVCFNIQAKNIEDIPEILQEFPSPQEEEAKFAFPLNLNGDIEHKISEKEEIEEKRTKASGNIRIYPYYHREDKISIDLDANFNLANNPLPEEEKVDLSNMSLKFYKNNSNLNFGDLNINESEYSISSLGRRGVNWVYNNQRVYINLFDVSSQQQKGFKGFGIPKSNISIFGGAIGYKFFNEKFSIKTIYLLGKDDPEEGTNVGSSELFQRRKGSTIAIIEETRLIKDKLNIKAEFAKSKYDENLEDEEGYVSDKAYKIGADFSSGSFFFGTHYNYIGKDFNPIGYQYFSNDRKGYDVILGFSIGELNISTSFNSEEDNVENDPQQLKTKNKSGNLNFQVNLSQNISLNLGYSKGKQNTYQDSTEVLGQDSITDEYNGSLSFNISNSSNIIFSITNSFISSEFMPENESSNKTANLGGNFRKGNFFVLNPSIGYSLLKNEFTNEETKTYNTFISGELYFFPSVLSLNFTTGFNKSETPQDFENESLNATLSLNFNLGNLVKKFQSILSLKGNYVKNKTNGLESSDHKGFLQLSFSF